MDFFKDMTLQRGFALGAVILLIIVIYYYQSMPGCAQQKTAGGCGCAAGKAGFVPAPNVGSYDLGNGIIIEPTGPFNSADQYAVRYSPSS